MKRNIRLKSLSIKHFKGIESLDIAFSHNDVEIHGNNGTGKTSVFDALTWVFFDRDSAGRNAFQLKPVDESGAEKHNLETHVTAVMEVDGEDFSISKTFREKWVKKRGAATTTFEGHETLYKIDDVPENKTAFKKRVAEIVEEETFRLLTNPFEFANLHWQERRRILMELCGDVTDSDVIASDPELDAIPRLLNGKNFVQARKIVDAKRKEINKELAQIPVRIDELAQKGVPAPPDTQKRTVLQKKMDDLRERLTTETDTSKIAELKVAIARIDGEIVQVQNSVPDRSKDREAVQIKIEAREAEIRGLNYHVDGLKRELDLLDKERLQVLAQDKELRAAFTHESRAKFQSDLVCQMCGQEMPSEKIEQAHAEFNQIKSKKLTDINVRGKENKARLEGIETQMDALRKEIAQHTPQAAPIREEIDRLKGQLLTIEQPRPDAKVIGELEARKRVVEMEITAIRDGAGIREKGIRDEIHEVERQLAEIAEAEAAYNAGLETIERMRELEEREKDLAAEFGVTENQLYLMDRFTVAKAALVENTINCLFRIARFKMFREQVNGGIDDKYCDILSGGVPMGKGLNFGASVNVGLDIIETLSRHYGIRCPIFIDNAESITHIHAPDTQIIRLVVDPDAHELTQVFPEFELQEAS